MQNDLIKIEKVSFKYREPKKHAVEVMKSVTFSVTEGEFTALVGPSGCGKSTLLRIILDLIPADSGKIERNFKNGVMVFQNFALFPWLTVFENVEFGLKMNGVGSERRKRIVHEKLAEVGLKDLGHRFPKELSGGQRQRVGIARALAVNPDLLVMDEPFSSLDSITAESLKKDILAIWQKYKMTVVMVTHLIPEAVEMADKVVIFSQKPSSIKKILDVDFPRPRPNRTEDFFAKVDEVTKLIEA